MLDAGLKLEIACPDIIGYSEHLQRLIFSRDNQLIIQLVPYDLDWLCLHLYSTHLHQPQQIYHLDARISPSAISTSY